MGKTWLWVICSFFLGVHFDQAYGLPNIAIIINNLMVIFVRQLEKLEKEGGQKN